MFTFLQKFVYVSNNGSKKQTKANLAHWLERKRTLFIFDEDKNQKKKTCLKSKIQKQSKVPVKGIEREQMDIIKK